MSVGKLLFKRCVAAASGLSRPELRRRFDRIRWQDAPSFEDWLADVDRVREDRFAVDAGHNVRGLTVISVPVLDPAGSLRRCVTVVALKEQLSPPVVGTLVKDVAAVARKLERAEF